VLSIIKKSKKEIKMKRTAMIFLMLIIGFCLVNNALAADKDVIQKQVDDIVIAIDNGKTAQDFMSASQNKPYYVFIMEEKGMLLVHPTLAGQSLKEKAEPAYTACAMATADGTWVSYIWKEKKKHTYVRKTKGGLIVGSGYSE
jgi:hypothetical protein